MVKPRVQGWGERLLGLGGVEMHIAKEHTYIQGWVEFVAFLKLAT